MPSLPRRPRLRHDQVDQHHILVQSMDHSVVQIIGVAAQRVNAAQIPQNIEFPGGMAILFLQKSEPEQYCSGS